MPSVRFKVVDFLVVSLVTSCSLCYKREQEKTDMRACPHVPLRVFHVLHVQLNVYPAYMLVGISDQSLYQPNHYYCPLAMNLY